MGFFDRVFGRGRRAPAWSNFGTSDQYVAFSGLVEAELRERGYEVEIRDGVATAMRDGERQHFGLQNLAQACARAPLPEWQAMIAGHFSRMEAGRKAAADIDAASGDLTSVASLLKLRIYKKDSIPTDDLVGWPVADDLLAALVFDLPTSVHTVSTTQRGRWDIGDDELRALALDNLDEEQRPAVQPVEGQKGVPLRVMSGDSFFVASRMLRLFGHLLEKDHPLGAIVAIPTRHVVLFHGIRGIDVIHAVNSMATLASAVFRDGPGSLSTQLYWAKADGSFLRLPCNVEGEKLSLSPPPAFVQLLESLAAPS